jgi:hypothetical protein
MMRAFLRQRLMVQFAALMTVLGLLVGLVFMTVRSSLIEVQALQRGRTVANMVDAFGAWASQYKGVWVRSDPADPSLKVGNFLEHRLNSKATPDAAPAAPSAPTFETKGLTAADVAAIAASGAFHSKNPALVQRELSEVVGASASAEKFRMTSDRFFNPNNAPTRFELSAIEAIRESDGAVSEYSEVKGNTLYYARRLMVSGPCMRCHDTPEKSPAVMQAKYAGTAGWGYKLGGVAGVISVTVPMTDRDISAVMTGLGAKAWVAVGAVVVMLLILLLWLYVTVIGAANKMQTYANRVKAAQRGEVVEKMQLDAEEVTSRNEIHNLSHALKAIARALNMAQRGNNGS